MGCYFQRRYILGLLLYVGIIITYILRMALNLAIIPVGDRMKWDDSTRGVLLSAFYWGYILTQVPGGWLAKKYGAKIIFGWGIASASLLTVIWPLTLFNFELSVIVRVLTGIGEGVTFPAAYHLIALWYPKTEKSTISASVTIAPSIGTVIANGLSPLVIDYLRWESIFYLAGGIGVIWSIFWLLLVIDYPTDRRSLSIFLPSEEEIEYIKSHQDRDDNHAAATKVSIKKIVTEPAFICIMINHFSYNWGYYVFASWLPTYLKKELNFDLDAAGIISILPYFLMTLVGIPSGYFADKLAAKRVARLIVIRKTFQMLGTVLPAFFLILLCSIPNLSVTGAVTIMFAALSTAPFTTAGHSSNFVDISTKYCGLLFSISNVGATVPGIVGVYFTGFILTETNNWNIVFLLAASLYILGAASFLFFAKVDKIDFDEDPERVVIQEGEEPTSEDVPSMLSLDESYGYQTGKKLTA